MMRHRMLHEKLDATKLYKVMHHLCCVVVKVSLYPYEHHHEQKRASISYAVFIYETLVKESSFTLRNSLHPIKPS
jgi:hypothetical protein